MSALLVFVAALVLYLLTLSANYCWDGVAFALLATEGDLMLPSFFPAEHLFYPATGWLWYRLWAALGFGEGALLPLQVLNALFGAAGVALFYLLVRRAWGRQGLPWQIALAAAILLAASYGYWYHSTDAEDLIIANTFTIVALYLIMRQTTPRAIALVFALAVLHHATQVLALPALIFGLRRYQQRGAAAFAGWLALFVGVAYLGIGVVYRGLDSPQDFVAWFSAAPRVGVWGRVSPQSLWLGIKTFAGSILHLGAGPNFRAILGGQWDAVNLLSALGFAAVLGGVFLLLAYAALRPLPPRQRPTLALVFLWAGPLALFALLWAPGDIQFWVPVIAPLALVMAAAEPSRALRGFPFYRGWAFLTVSIVIFAINLTTAMLPRHDLGRNQGYHQAMCLAQNTQPDDLVIAPGWDWAGSYGPYFAQRRVFSIIDSFVLDAGRDRRRLISLLGQALEEAQRPGGRAYVARLWTLDDQGRAWLLKTTGLTPEDFPLPRREAFSCGNEVIFEVLGPPTADMPFTGPAP